jgi:transposase
MTTMVEDTRAITGGVDTHADLHVAAALDSVGGLLGVREFPATAAGYAELPGWLRSLGNLALAGVEGTGSYGAGLARYLAAAGVRVVEVDRPDRQDRHRQGKSDPLDAVSAARAAQSGRASGAPRGRDGAVEAIRVALRELGRRAQFLDGQLDRLDELIGPLVTERAPGLLALHGVGPDTAALLLVAAGDHPERLRSESSWAHLCGVAPIPASSGKTAGRYRLNRGGDRQANSALWRVVMVRLRSHEATRAYADRRGKEGLSKKEIIRCLKRYVAREVYRQLRAES